MQSIKRAVCKYWKIKVSDLTIKNGTRSIKNAKQCFVILANEKGFTYGEIRNELELTNGGMTYLKKLAEKVADTDDMKFTLKYLRGILK